MRDVPVAIVIFGAAVLADGRPSTALRRRVLAALAAGRHMANPLYVPTGGIGRVGPAEAAVMAAMLRARGVAAERIIAEDTATSTFTSALAVTRLLREHGHDGPVYAASNAYHLPRCVLLLWLAGLDAWACPAPRGPASRRLVRRWYWRLREVAAIPRDLTRMLAWRLLGLVGS